jgi:hypothetical protein
MEYFRKTKRIPVIDFTLEICSPSMYYAYISGKKHLGEDKINALKDRLGADKMSGDEVKEYLDELEDVHQKLHNFRFEIDELKTTFEILSEYETQLVLEDRLVIKYLITMAYTSRFLGFQSELKHYLHILSLIEPLHSHEQHLFYLDLSADEPGVSYEKNLSALHRLEDELKGINEDNPNLGILYLSLGKKYLSIHKNYQSNFYLEKAIDFYRRCDCFRGIIIAKNGYIANLISTKRIPEALKELEMNLIKAKEINYLPEIHDIKTKQLLCYSLLKQTDNVLNKYHEIFHEIVSVGITVQEYHNFVIILSVLDHFHMNAEITNLIRIIEKQVPKSPEQAYNDIIKYYTITNEEERIYFAEVFLETYSDVPYYFDWQSNMYQKVIGFYETQRRYKKVAELNNKYVEYMQKYFI